MPTANQKRMIHHINATVFKLLRDYHFDEITIQKVCDVAEINRSTFYRYFQDKYELLYTLPDYIATQFQNEDTKLFASTEESFQQFIYFIGENKKVFRHLLTSSRQADVFRNLTHVSRDLMLENVKHHNDPLALKIQQSQHPEIIADFYSSGMIEVFRRWVEQDYNYSVDEIFSTLHDILDMSFRCTDQQ